jgi:Tol biopolymer transport system component
MPRRRDTGRAMSQEHINGLRRTVPLRRGHGFAAVASALGCLVAAVPAAEASFPGRNGVLAFARLGPGDASTISVVDPRSGRTRAVTHVSRSCAGRAGSWADWDPSFSASGRLLIYGHTDRCDPRTPDGVYVIRPGGRGRRLVTRKELDRPVFSPSGESIASVDVPGRMLITDFDQPARERELLPRSDYPTTLWPAWSVTGRLALTVSRREARDSGHIATVTSQGRDLRLVTRSHRDSTPDWSPTGDRIAFERDKGDRSDILVASAHARRGRRPKRLTHTRDAFWPVWSPNGEDIAYVRGDFANKFSSLVIMRARDGGRKRRVENHVDPISRISWQPRHQP